MKDHVFIADDGQIDPSDFENMCRAAADSGFERPIEYPGIETKRDTLLSQARSLASEGNRVYLITDAMFLLEPDPSRGGARLAEDFFRIGGLDSRVVIRSSQPELTPSLKGDPRVLAVRKTYPLKELFRFLKTGKAPKTLECLEYLRRLDAIRDLFSVSEGDQAEDVAMIAEALSLGIGAGIPEPFDGSTLDMFDSSVKGALGQGFHQKLWEDVVESFHPYRPLNAASSGGFSPGKPPGNFIVLWSCCQARNRPPSELTELRKSEERFGPREQEWILRRRRVLAARIRAEYSGKTESERWGQLLAGVREEFKSIHSLLTGRNEVGG